MPRLIVGSLFVIVLVVGALGAVAYAKIRQFEAASSAPPPPEMPVAVDTAKASDQPYRKSSLVIGTVLASQSVTLSNELTGVVTDVAVKPGDLVRQGQVLVQFDTQLESAELQSAIATKELADAALARNERLKRSGAGSEQLLEVAKADVSRSAAEVERMRVLIDKKTLVAPFDARVGLFDIHPGQYLSAGTEITELSGISDYLNVDFSMPQKVASSVIVGNNVELISASLSERIQSPIIAIDASANSQSRSLLARARIEQPPSGLHPGDSIKVRIPYGSMIPSVTVPSTAIRRGPAGTAVYVMTEQEGQFRAQLRPVMILSSEGLLTWIAEGIDAGETVVTDGSFKVTDGTLLATGDAS